MQREQRYRPTITVENTSLFFLWHKLMVALIAVAYNRGNKTFYSQQEIGNLSKDELDAAMERAKKDLAVPSVVEKINDMCFSKLPTKVEYIESKTMIDKSGIEKTFYTNTTGSTINLLKVDQLELAYNIKNLRCLFFGKRKSILGMLGFYNKNEQQLPFIIGKEKGLEHSDTVGHNLILDLVCNQDLNGEEIFDQSLIIELLSSLGIQNETWDSAKVQKLTVFQPATLILLMIVDTFKLLKAFYRREDQNDQKFYSFLNDTFLSFLVDLYNNLVEDFMKIRQHTNFVTKNGADISYDLDFETKTFKIFNRTIKKINEDSFYPKNIAKIIEHIPTSKKQTLNGSPLPRTPSQANSRINSPAVGDVKDTKSSQSGPVWTKKTLNDTDTNNSVNDITPPNSPPRSESPASTPVSKSERCFFDGHKIVKKTLSAEILAKLIPFDVKKESGEITPVVVSKGHLDSFKKLHEVQTPGEETDVYDEETETVKFVPGPPICHYVWEKETVIISETSETVPTTAQ